MIRLAGLADFSAWFWPLLADHLWQTTAFAVLALGSAALLRNGPPRARQSVWLLASLKLALPSFAIVALAGAAGLDRPEILRTVDPGLGLADLAPSVDRLASPFAGTAGAARSAPPRDRRRDVCTALTLVWAAGVLVTAARWWRRRLLLSRAVASGEALVAGREIRTLARAARRTGARGSVALVVSGGIEQPGVHGVLRSRIVLPEGIAERLSDDELEAVLAHELVHVRRRDNLIGNLHMGLCCLFWFYPVVWLLDRRLLVERERACDDEVLASSGSPAVYASSLLKVCRFCLGPRVAGVSDAGGSGLRDRVARIVAHRPPGRLTAAHRALVGAVAVVLAVFVVAGLSGADGAGAIASVPPATLATPAPPAQGAPPAEVTPEQVDRAPRIPVSFDNAAGAAVRILRATARVVPLDSGEDLFTPPALELRNATGRRVVFVRIGFGSPPRWNDVVGFATSIEPFGDSRLEPDWRSWSNTVDAAAAHRLVARIAGVRFEDGGHWGTVDDGVIAPPAPAPDTPAEDGEASAEAGEALPAWTIAARFENPPEAPVLITAAAADRAPSSDGGARLPIVTLRNTTDWRVTHLKLRFKAGSPAHAVSSLPADIPPGGDYVFRSRSSVEGEPGRMHVQLLGVRFENGSIWGAFDTRIDTREPTVAVPQRIRRPGS